MQHNVGTSDTAREGIGSRPSPRPHGSSLRRGLLRFGGGGRCGGHDPGKGKGVIEAVAPADSSTIAIMLCGDKARTYLFLVEWARQDKTPHAPPEGNKSSQTKGADSGRGHHTGEGKERFSITLRKITHRQK